jgi:hypothetical protein
VFEDPNVPWSTAFRQAVDPIKSEIGQLREFYSRREATASMGPRRSMLRMRPSSKGCRPAIPR